jgi:hypothetical protein
MPDATNSSPTGRRRQPMWPALLGAGCAMAIAACGGSPKLNVSGTATNATGNSSPIAMSRCMRAHGLSNFPDPKMGSGGLGFPGGVLLSQDGSLTVDGVSFSGPALQSAEKGCKAFLPGGGGPPPPISAARRQAMLANAACMREHGVPNFADPTFPAHGGVELHLGPGVNPQSPAFQAAAKACGSAVGRF